MPRVKFIFSSGLTLEYVVNNTKAASAWIGMLSQMRPRYLLWNKRNGHHGFASAIEVRQVLWRFREVGALLGFEIGAIDRNSWHAELNRLHTHFPAVWKNKSLTHREFQLYHEMNLTIHWLEYELANLYEAREQSLINLDFNHHPPAYGLKQPFTQEELALYSPMLEFGTLHLHYIYIGRHFLEMADAQDFVSPSDHFKAQWEFNATCGLVFSEPQSPDTVHNKLRSYFDQRGGKQFFGYEFDDCRLAKGFFPLGRLANLCEFTFRSSRSALRDQVRQQKIVDWVITPS